MTKADSQLPSQNNLQPPQKRGAFTRFLDTVEWMGNLLPHPITLFAIAALGIVLLSGLFGAMGLSVEDPRPEGAAGRSADGLIQAVSLLNADGFRKIITNLVKNFTSFAPLGVVLVAMLGIGVAEKSGLFTAAVRSIVLNVPRHAVTVAIVFAGVLSNMASELGYIVLIPLGGAVFYSLGRHPLAGMAAAFAGVSGGYSANILIGTIDPLLAGITEEAARLIDPTYMVTATANYYFASVSTFVITIVGSLVSIFIVEPKLGPYDRSKADASILDGGSLQPLSALENRGLKVAGLAALGVLIFLALMLIPEWGPLRDPVTGDRLRSPFFSGFVTWIFVFFLVVGFAYGKVVGTMKNDKDIINGMSSAISTLGVYVVIVFFAAQLIAFFNWTNIGAIVAVTGADFLHETGLTGPLVFIPFILICCIVNLMIGSASAQWAMTSPIFVPMLMLIGYSPELIQAAYRIGDSTTNIITPMMSYFGLILAWATRYDKGVGIGTMIAMMLPYSIFFTIFWTALFYVWVFLFGLPVGPGAPTFYPAGN